MPDRRKSRCRLHWLCLATACWLATLMGHSAPLAAQSVQVTVGSKSFTESVVLGEMLKLLAESAGATVHHKAELGGTQILWKALQAGDIDAYVEYTGTIEEEIFGGQNIVGWQQISDAMQPFDIVTSKPLGFNNTYALGMKESFAKKHRIRTISDLREHLDLRFGFSDEFTEREDGWLGLRRTYGLSHQRVRGMLHTLAYHGLEAGSLHVIDLYSTDPEIAYYRLRVLDDDRGFFPIYQAVILFRQDLEERAPDVVAAFRQVEGQIDGRTMSNMNQRVQIDRLPETIAAAAYLNENIDDTIEVPEASRSEFYKRRFWRFVTTTREHLVLVSVSLAAAILAAIPLGIAAYKFPKAGHIILGVVGIIQTLPSMALLVFMIPLLGLGAWPAIVALFLYSLLPIVRNTYTGLQDLPDHIHESALALGLPDRARLRLIELPMASRSILAGIKTAAVINVGTATIGALIGAGGYGQPILTGIRLDDLGLILQGAIPAAVLALLVQSGFGWAERWLVPRGLRTG